MDSHIPEIRVGIAPPCQGILNKVNLIAAEFEGFMVLGYLNMSPGILFEVVADEYVLGIEFRENDVVFVRNDTAIVASFGHPASRGQQLVLNYSWSPNEISLHLTDEDGHRGHTASTAPTFPPQSLRQWARREALIPVVTYDSNTHLFEAVMDQFYKLQQSLRDTNGINGFWDVQYEGQKIAKKSPKRETDVHPTIRLLLYDLEIIKNFQIIPEYPIGGGRLDFLIMAPLRDGTIGKVCVEFKNAHSDDLANGIMVQLPEYMDRTGTDYGVYAVLDFGAAHSFKSRRFQIEKFSDEFDSLEMALNIGASESNKKFLRPVILPVGPSTPPSKRG